MWLFVLETLRCWTRLHQLAEPSHPCGQYAAAPLTLVHITLHLHNSTQSPRSGRARLFLFQFVQHETKAAHDSSAD